MPPWASLAPSLCVLLGWGRTQNQHEFPALLANMLFFNKAWKLFSRMDANYDRRLEVTEFKRGAMYLGLWLTPEVAAVEFEKVRRGGMLPRDARRRVGAGKDAGY